MSNVFKKAQKGIRKTTKEIGKGVKHLPKYYAKQFKKDPVGTTIAAVGGAALGTGIFVAESVGAIATAPVIGFAAVGTAANIAMSNLDKKDEDKKKKKKEKIKENG